MPESGLPLAHEAPGKNERAKTGHDWDWVAALKIGDNKIAKGAYTAAAATARRVGGDVPAAEAVPRPADTSAILGIPEAELTPKVRDAIMNLMREVETLRRELLRSNARLADLEKLADQDALVPLHNRRAFVREMSRLMSYAQRYNAPASLVFFDVNGLKAINDTNGHAAGDAALQLVSATLTESVRESDVVGRLGGDEFGVLLAYANEQQAREKAEQLDTAIANRPLEWEGKKISVIVAWGVYSFKAGEDVATALDAADKAMYAKKASMKAKT